MLKIATLALLAVNAASAESLDFSWAHGIGGFTLGYGIAADSVGNTHVTGQFTGTADFDPGPGVLELSSLLPGTPSIFLAKYDPAGTPFWARVIGGDGLATGRDLAVDAQGNVYLTGWYEGTVDFDPGPGEFSRTSFNASDAYVVKLNASGNFVWAFALSNTNTSQSRAVAVDPSGHVYLTGRFAGTVEFDPGPGSTTFLGAGAGDAFVLKLDPSGNLMWVRVFTGPGGNEGTGIGVDASGNVFVGGAFFQTIDFDPAGQGLVRESGGAGDLFLAKLDANGSLAWVRTMGGSADNNVKHLAMGPDGSAYITGEFDGTANFDPDGTDFELTSVNGSDAFVARYDSNGAMLWARALGVTDSSRGEGIAVDAQGSAYSTGSFIGTNDFDPGPGVFNLVANFSNRTFISKLDANGDFAWAKSVGGTSPDWGFAIDVDPFGGVHVTGRFQGTANFDPGEDSFELTSDGTVNGFVLRLKGPDEAIPTSISGIIRDAITDEPLACAAVEVHDLELGERVIAVTDANGEYFFEPLPAGTYGVRVLAPGYETLTPGIIVLDGEAPRTDEYLLMPRGTAPVVAGRVLDADTSQPLVWVFVQLFVDGSFVDDSYTCGGGFYEIPLPVIGIKDDEAVDIELQFSLPNFDTETVQRTIDPSEGATVNETLQKSVLGISFLTGSVRGRTGANSQPLEGARITLRGPISTSIAANAEGLYFLDTLLDGSYTVTASAEGFAGRSVQRTLPPSSGAEANFELLSTAPPPAVPGDVNGDGVVNAVDVQLVINAALGVAIDPAFTPDINGDGVVNAVDVQLVINAALGIDIG